jgi:thiamine transport system substrate-binding protein
VTRCYKAFVTLRVAAAVAVVGVSGLAVVACGGGEKARDVVLVTHDSFVIPKSVKAGFERETGLHLRILRSGDAGEALTKALLTAGNPQGDVFFGVDNNLLSRALGDDLFEPYEPVALSTVDKAYDLDPEHRVVPVDHSEVCLVYDRDWFDAQHMAPPRSMGVLVQRDYARLTVVENPQTSTPGLAFLLATIARFGPFSNGWPTYWSEARAGGILVTDGWEEAYNERFSGSGHGTYPIVVSYSTDPAAAVYFAGKPLAKSPVAVVEDSCFGQIEFAGVLRGAHNEEGAQKLVDFLLSRRFQAGMPLTMFVLPTRSGVGLPRVFREHAPAIAHPLKLSPTLIGENRDRWVKEWTQIVIR